MEAQYLTNQFLIAMPALGDPNFNQTVTYICEHTSEGALGIVINRPMNVKLGEILSQLAVDRVDDAVSDIPVLLGGLDSLMIGRILYDEFFVNRDWPVAAAAAIVLLMILVIPIMVFQHNQVKRAEADL